MNSLKDIIQRCHQRREKSLQQRKTVITPALYKGIPYHFTVYCAYRYPVKLYELEQAGVSFMPIGRAPAYESGPADSGGERFLTRQGIEDWDIRQWHGSYGIQVYTGIPSARDGACWHDLNFTYEAVCAAPDAVLVCIKTLVNIVANPLLTITKSGGLRFSCRVRDYLHPHTETARQYIYTHTPTPENAYQQTVYLEIFGDKGFNRWDARYEILLGNLLAPPIISKEALFAPIDALRDTLHHPVMLGEKALHSVVLDHPVAPASLGSHNLDLAPPFPSDTLLAVREGKLSPLAIKRPPTMLQKSEGAKKDYAPLENNAAPIQRVFDGNARVLVLIAEKGGGKSYGVETYVRNSSAISLRAEVPQTFLNPRHSETVETLLGQDAETERLCILDNVQSHELFSKCSLSKYILEAWSVNWQGHALGHFSKALLNAVENTGDPDGNAVRRIRTTLHAFERQAGDLIQQMCQANESGTVSARASISDPQWTFWHRLQHFFAYYKRDADAPMIWYQNALKFWVPPLLHRRVKRLLLMSSSLTERDVRQAFPHTEIEVTRLKPTAWVAGNKVFQIRTDTYPHETLLEYYHNWNILGVSKTGQRIFSGIRAEIERDPSVKHAIVTYMPIVEQLKDILEIENVCLVSHFKGLNRFASAFEEAQVIWIVGTPHWAPGTIWRRSQILYGNDERPLSYETDTEPYRYKDERVQRVYEQHTVGHLSEIVGLTGLNRLSGKTVVLVTSVRLPDITDRPETLLFDWEDFEVAGGLDKLPETIAIRERFEIERAHITADTHRTEVERILGCSARQAYRVLNKLRGGNIPRVLFREQIFSLLANGERKASELVEAIEGHPTSIRNELTRLLDAGEIVKVRWGVYKLPPSTDSK